MSTCTHTHAISPTTPPHSVRMSALALLKIAMHARSGGNLEVCGRVLAVALKRARAAVAAGLPGLSGQLHRPHPSLPPPPSAPN